jgi:Protein of unknown function (DUF3011)
MNSGRWMWCFLFTLAAILGAQAQDEMSSQRSQDAVKCESNNGGRNYCGNYNSNQVRLDRQISSAPCVEGRTWGVDGRGLWVDRGCRAYFVIRRGGGGGGGGNGGANSVRCESNNGARNYCGNYSNNQVKLDRQISSAPGIENRTWGVDNRGLWVDRGCRALFTVRRGGGGGGGGWPGGNISVPSVRADTSGRGNYSGPGQSIRVTRGYLDTTGSNVTIALSGQNVKVTFYGRATRRNGDREFTMDINGSDRGKADGTAIFRFNSDRNEVEFISVNGRINGGRFTGSFSR